MEIEVIIEKIPYGGKTIVVGYDASPESPREWDNLGEIYSNCRRFSPDNLNIEKLIQEVGGNVYAQTIPWNLIEKKYYYRKVWMYDHSGQTIKTGEVNPFSCPWDSGLAGVIVCDKERAKKEYGYNRCCKGLEEKVLRVLDGEIETLDQFLQGEIYAYEVEDENGDIIDSCYGYYDKDETIAEAKSVIDYNNKK